MKYDYNKEFKVNYTQTDSNLKLSLINSVSLIQDSMTEYFESLGSDNIKIKKEDNALWVVTKTKINFFKIPIWNDDIVTNGYIVKNKNIRVETENTFKYSNGDLSFVTNQELCVIDVDTRKLRKIDTISFPKEIEIRDSVVNTEYLKLNDEFSENDFCYEQEALLSDIDYSKHVNNIAYVRYLLNTLSSEFFDKIVLKDFEIHYISESKERQKLRIYKKQFSNEIRFLVKESDREIVRASIKFEI